MLAWGKKVSPLFRERLVAVAERLGADPDHLMACIAFESAGTFDPSVKNKDSGATGLIQFMPSTARGLGTSIDALAAMTAEDQLEYVEKHFAPFRGRLKTLEDVYMAILLPLAVGKPDDYVVFDKNDRKHPLRYVWNAPLDIDRDSQVTKAEAAARVRKLLAEGLRPGNASV